MLLRRLCVATLLLTACSGGATDVSPAPVTSATPTLETTGPSATTTTTTSAATEGGRLDVVIPASGLDLVAVVTTPGGAGPFPTVVIVGGSGPVDKEGTAPGQLNMVFPRPIPVYAELADGLAGLGVASVRYDKRTCVPFNGCADNGYPVPAADLTFGTFVEDAVAVARWAAGQVTYDPVYVVGHSQGGTVALLVLDQVDAVEGVVLLAAPYRDIDDLLSAQAEFSRQYAASLGMDTARIDAAVSPLEDLASQVSAIGGGTFDGDTAGGASVEFWESWLAGSAAARTVMEETDRPVVAISGSYDWNILPAELDLWEANGASVELLECLTHAFNCVSEPDPTAITPADVGKEVAGILIERVTAVVAP
ncbi:MAG: alpha/beta fold hydrolase [Acidimicrobiia bacterium]|nr:alpha/beta fold hydrolase [Acidimicrobiia bacterium]